MRRKVKVAIAIAAFVFATSVPRLAIAQTPAGATRSKADGQAIGDDVIAATRKWVAGDAAGKRALEDLAHNGRPDAQEALGEMLETNLAGPGDAVLACDYFRQASSARRDALHSLAFCTETGVGRPPDPSKAAQLYARAADEGYPKSMCALGNLYIAGRGVSADPQRGAALCRRGAEGGDKDAQTDLGNLYLNGLGLPHDVVQARFWYEKAAAQNQANAQFTLGQIYWNGDGVGRDRTKAAALWKFAYHNGRLDAASLLGDWALASWAGGHPKGDLSRLDEAIGWYEAALKAPPNDEARAKANKALTLARAARDEVAKTDDDGFNRPPATARSGDFAVGQVATTDPDRLTADWLKPAPGVSMQSSTQVPRNRPIVTFIIFKGCRADAAGNCNVTADFETLDPSGKPYDQTKSAEIWVGHPPAPSNNLQLSASGYGLRIEDKDALGSYLFRATITDHVANVTLQTEQILTAVAK